MQQALLPLDSEIFDFVSPASSRQLDLKPVRFQLKPLRFQLHPTNRCGMRYFFRARLLAFQTQACGLTV
jgi:hypothetical protein